MDKQFSTTWFSALNQEPGSVSSVDHQLPKPTCAAVPILIKIGDQSFDGLAQCTVGASLARVPPRCRAAIFGLDWFLMGEPNLIISSWHMTSWAGWISNVVLGDLIKVWVTFLEGLARKESFLMDVLMKFIEVTICSKKYISNNYFSFIKLISSRLFWTSWHVL